MDYHSKSSPNSCNEAQYLDSRKTGTWWPHCSDRLTWYNISRASCHQLLWAMVHHQMDMRISPLWKIYIAKWEMLRPDRLASWMRYWSKSILSLRWKFFFSFVLAARSPAVVHSIRTAASLPDRHQAYCHLTQQMATRQNINWQSHSRWNS